MCLLFRLFVNMFWCQTSQKRLQIEAQFQWTTCRKWHMANRMVTWPKMSRDSLWSSGIACSWRSFAPCTSTFCSSCLTVTFVATPSDWVQCWYINSFVNDFYATLCFPGSNPSVFTAAGLLVVNLLQTKASSSWLPTSTVVKALMTRFFLKSVQKLDTGCYLW